MSATGVLNSCLFKDPEVSAYAILDGASVPTLLDHLYTERPEFECLYRGELEPDMAEVAPYLVRLEHGHRFTSWLVENSFGKHWGVYILSTEKMKILRKHFRKFLLVQGVDGNPVYFRYYDPRVLGVYLPGCNQDETANIFETVNAYLFEAEGAECLLRFSVENDLPYKEQLSLERGGA